MYNHKGEPLWAAKAEKPSGIGLGLGKGKTFSSGIGFSKTSQQQADDYTKKQMTSTGGSFYSQQQVQMSQYSKTGSGFYNSQQQSQEVPKAGAKDDPKKKQKDIAPKRFALKFDPPTISKFFIC